MVENGSAILPTAFVLMPIIALIGGVIAYYLNQGNVAMRLPVEIESCGREHSETDPLHYQLIDAEGRVICDTLNVWQFDVGEQRKMMELIANAINAAC